MKHLICWRHYTKSRVTRSSLLGTMNGLNKFYSNPSNFCLHISVWIKVVDVPPTITSLEPHDVRENKPWKLKSWLQLRNVPETMSGMTQDISRNHWRLTRNNPTNHISNDPETL